MAKKAKKRTVFMPNHQLAPAKYHFCDSWNEHLMFRCEAKIVEKIHCAVLSLPMIRTDLSKPSCRKVCPMDTRSPDIWSDFWKSNMFSSTSTKCTCLYICFLGTALQNKNFKVLSCFLKVNFPKVQTLWERKLAICQKRLFWMP